MRKVTVKVTYIVEIETDLEDKDEIDDFVADYISLLLFLGGKICLK